MIGVGLTIYGVCARRSSRDLKMLILRRFTDFFNDTWDLLTLLQVDIYFRFSYETLRGDAGWDHW